MCHLAPTACANRHCQLGDVHRPPARPGGRSPQLEAAPPSRSASARCAARSARASAERVADSARSSARASAALGASTPWPPRRRRGRPRRGPPRRGRARPRPVPPRRRPALEAASASATSRLGRPPAPRGPPRLSRRRRSSAAEGLAGARGAPRRGLSAGGSGSGSGAARERRGGGSAGGSVRQAQAAPEAGRGELRRQPAFPEPRGGRLVDHRGVEGLANPLERALAAPPGLVQHRADPCEHGGLGRPGRGLRLAQIPASPPSRRAAWAPRRASPAARSASVSRCLAHGPVDDPRRDRRPPEPTHLGGLVSTALAAQSPHEGVTRRDELRQRERVERVHLLAEVPGAQGAPAHRPRMGRDATMAPPDREDRRPRPRGANPPVDAREPRPKRGPGLAEAEREQLILGHMPLVRSLARRYANRASRSTTSSRSARSA